jgi:hypothetical protein
MVLTIEQLTAALAGLLTKNEIPAAPARATLSGFEQKSLYIEKKQAVSLYHKELRRVACGRFVGKSKHVIKLFGFLSHQSRQALGRTDAS